MAHGVYAERCLQHYNNINGINDNVTDDAIIAVGIVIRKLTKVDNLDS